jgi:hypothetical protein
MAEITHNENHVTEMLARVAQQYKSDEGFAAILTAVGTQVQEIEDAFYQVHIGYRLEDAEGDQLDVLGKIVNQPRDGATDEEYLPRIRARIKALLSSGSVDDLYAVLAALFNTTAVGTYSHYTEGPQGQRITLNVQTSEELAALTVSLIGRARAALERTIIEWFQGALADTFVTPLSTNLDGGESAGATAINVYSTAGFPATGTLRFSAGTADEEDKAYSAVVGNVFTCTALANTHDDRATVELVDATAGDGFGDEANAATGGELAGGALAT